MQKATAPNKNKGKRRQGEEEGVSNEARSVLVPRWYREHGYTLFKEGYALLPAHAQFPLISLIT